MKLDTYLLIALFDTGSDDNQPFCVIYSVGKGFIEGEDIGNRIREVMKEEATDAFGKVINEDLLDVAIMGELLTWRAWSQEEIMGVFADQEKAKCRVLSTIDYDHTDYGHSELDISECECGFLFIDQPGYFVFNCPKCNKVIDTKEILK